MKKRVAILFSGQIRNHFLGDGYQDDTLSKFLLTSQFKEKFDYDIFISVDRINIEKTIEYFGNSLKNIHFLETGYFLKPITKKILPFDYYNNKFIHRDFESLYSYPDQFYQYYRMYDCFNLIENPEDYDYIVRLRPDIIFLKDCMEFFDHKFSMEHNLFWVSSKPFHDFYRIILENYGSYRHIFDMSMYLCIYEGANPYKFKYCSETQILNAIYTMCLELNFDISNTFKGFIYNTHLILDPKRK